ncbi:Cna B-type domain-containing protein, partial [Methanobrevibacter sp.]|uniref:Cna B-type domain-containing protein n=1 Tax=Methanobrevibacter sp. TaxID=66852 RepID=UPI0025ECFDC3
DGNNAWGTRPANITVYLLADGVRVANATLNESNGWYHEFTNLTVFNGNDPIKYSIEELNVTVNMTNVPAGVISVEYVSVVDNSTAYNWTVNNTLVTVVNATKIWNDGNNAWNTRPDNITVYLLADGVRVANATLNEANNWYHEFTNLTAFNGNDEIVYNIEEVNVTGHTSVTSNSTAYNFTIVNTPLVNVSVIKVWTDNDNQDGVRNASVTIHLVKNNETVIATVVLNDTNNWRYVFEGLDKYQNNGTLINYTVTEDELENYTVKITGNNYEFIVNNTHVIELVNVTVVKVWTDNDNQDGVRNASVTIHLVKNN